MAVTRKDVAKRARVSVATVSYVINDGPRPVSEETREKILQAIKELDYHPNMLARSLKTRRTFSIGLVVSDILNPFWSTVAKGAEDAVRSAGYDLILCNSDEDPDRELAYLRILQGKQVDGILLVPTGGNRQFITSIVARGKPLVQLDRRLEGLDVDTVQADNEAGAYEAVRHLIDLGHTRIGLMHPPSHLTPGRGRRRGYEQALIESGLPLKPELMREGSFKEDSGYTLAQEVLALTPPPTALFIGNNRLALGVLRVLKERGLRMPDDIALCVFDDLEYYALMTPSITAVDQPAYEIGQKGVELLLSRIDDDEVQEPRLILLKPRLHIRESTVGFQAQSASS